jgi:DNA-binding NarL/FixJ family response regulator
VLPSDEHLLINQIHSSLDEMRKLRSQLRSQPAAISQPTTNGKKDSGLALMHRYGLTRREAQVAALLAQGLPNLEIAEELEISAHTARHHIQGVLSKLNVHSRAAAGGGSEADDLTKSNNSLTAGRARCRMRGSGMNPGPRPATMP